VHEAIEATAEVDRGDAVLYETRDAFDLSSDRARPCRTVAAAKLGPVHPLSEPVFVGGAEPGDLLEAEIVAIEPDPWDQWGLHGGGAEAEGRGETGRAVAARLRPGTAADIKWWLGSTVAAVRRALADLHAVEVDLNLGLGLG
jgi:acetamidase/formamidase